MSTDTADFNMAEWRVEARADGYYVIETEPETIGHNWFGPLEYENILLLISQRRDMYEIIAENEGAETAVCVC